MYLAPGKGGKGSVCVGLPFKGDVLQIFDTQLWDARKCKFFGFRDVLTAD